MSEKFLDRILRVIKLDATVFAEVEKDESATVEAFIIVLATSFLAALGTGIGSRGRFLGAFLGAFLASVILNWIVWSFITLWIGTNVFHGKADLGEMLRTIGYANAPRFIGFFSFIPLVGWILSLAGAILSLIAAFLAIREALELDTTKTIATVVIGWIIIFIISIILAAIFAGAALTIGAV